jgi:signal transduction histidine kinase
VGLPIARKIVHVHGGSLTMSSDRPRQGKSVLRRLTLATPSSTGWTARWTLA